MASNFWLRSNDDSRAAQFRSRYGEENAGSWEKTRAGWVWVDSTPTSATVQTAPTVKVAEIPAISTAPEVKPVTGTPKHVTQAAKKKKFWNK